MKDAKNKTVKEVEINLTSNMEDYLKTIYLLDKSHKVVRVKQIAEKLNVKMASVTGALKSLMEKGMVNHDRYGYVELTEDGRKIAEQVYKKQFILADFFEKVLQIPFKEAEDDACKMEHIVSKQLLDRMILFLRFLEDHKIIEDKFIQSFEKYINEAE